MIGSLRRVSRLVSPGTWLVSAAVVVIHIATNSGYGIFRDEFYYLACADHPGWGYVDQPPLSIWLLWLIRAVIGDSAQAIRLAPALAHALLVVGTGRLAREMGGGRSAELIAAIAAAIAIDYLAITNVYSMNAFDLLFWVAAALIVARRANGGSPRLWLLFGVAVGLGLLNKVSILFFCAGLAIALPFTPLRRDLRSPHVWSGALIAVAMFLPHIAWQVRFGWPTLEFMRNAAQLKNVHFGTLAFLTAVAQEIQPLNAIVSVIGLAALVFMRRLDAYRLFAVIFIFCVVLFVRQSGKPYYLAPAFPPLFAAAAFAIERWTESRLRWVRGALVVLLVAGGLSTAPLALPLLPPESYVAYSRALGIAPSGSERSALGPLPQHFADRFGWQEMAEAVARVYWSLPEAERRRAAILGDNYGEAAAITYYGRSLGLPPAISQHNSYYLWGPGNFDGSVLITVGRNPDDLRKEFDSVIVAGRLTSTYAMPYETRRPILICRGFRQPLDRAWQAGKKYI